MSVPTNKRGKNTLEVWQESVVLTKYTMEIVSNAKNFPGRYRKMNDALVETSFDISRMLWFANNIYVGKGAPPGNVEERLHLQSVAIAECREMLFEIELAGKVLHRPTKKTAYWSNLAKVVLDRARKWHESDERRLRA